MADGCTTGPETQFGVSGNNSRPGGPAARAVTVSVNFPHCRMKPSLQENQDTWTDNPQTAIHTHRSKM